MSEEPYIFKLRFDDDQNSLTKQKGLSIKELSILLKALDDVSNTGDESSITLMSIEEGSYIPFFAIFGQNRYERLVTTHENIDFKGLNDLTKEERKYVKTINKELLVNNRFIESIDNENNVISKVYSTEINKSVEHYFRITTITGVISEIGSPNLKGQTHIDVDGVGYKIHTNLDQDLELRKYYRINKVQFKIKQKVSVERDKVISAKLLDFKVHNEGNLIENLSKLKQEDLSIVRDIHSHEELLRLVRD